MPVCKNVNDCLIVTLHFLNMHPVYFQKLTQGKRIKKFPQYFKTITFIFCFFVLGKPKL